MATGDALAPRCEIVVNGTELGEFVMQFVTEVTVEKELGMIDSITIQLANPIVDSVGANRTSKLAFTDSMALMPGNVVEVFMGYGATASDGPIAAGIIRKYMPDFPQTGMPMITLKCLSGGCEMMDGSPDVNANQARPFDEGISLGDMAVSICTPYGFNTDEMASVETEATIEVCKKAGMSDYNFIQGLANMLGFEFKITWDFDAKGWKVYFDVAVADDSDKKEFVWGPDKYSRDDAGLLLSFQPEFGIQNAPTDIELYYFDRDTNTWEKIIYPPEEPSPQRGNSQPEFAWEGDETSAATELASATEPATGRGLRIKAGGIAVEVIPTQNFGSAEDAVTWAEAWFNARMDQLIKGNGTIVGYPGLEPGQVHTLSGLGDGLSGDWYITAVTQNFSQGSGYTTDFSARKIIR